MNDFMPVATAQRIGQGTAVEQARAATEVQGAIYIAQQNPRNIEAAYGRMREACSQIELAEEAFYNYPQGGQTVTGMTIEVACEIGTCWGNFDYGLKELLRDHEHGQSEMYAYAWDLEVNVRLGSTFIVPHIRDTRGGGRKLTEMRDITQLNSNIGNRKMREAIFKVLPRRYVKTAEATLRQTLARQIENNKKPLPQQINEASASFRERFNIGVPQLENWANKTIGHWTPDDLVRLKTLWTSLSRNEISLDSVFPSARITAEELATAPAAEHTGEHDLTGFGPDCAVCRQESADVDRAAAEDGAP